MDAEKMAREFFSNLRLNSNVGLAPNVIFHVSDDIVCDFATLLTTAHNAGLERAAEIADGVYASGDSPWTIAQAIRREIK